MGHVLMDIGCHVNRKTDLMVTGGEALTDDYNEWKVEGPKRISNEELDFDDGKTKGSPVSLTINNNGDVIDAW